MMGPMRVPLALIAIQIGWLQGAAQEPRRAGPVILELGAGVLTLAFAPDGATVYGGGGDLIGHRSVTVIRGWDPASGKLLRELKGQGMQVSSVAVSPDGTLVASAPFARIMVGPTAVHLWDAATGNLIAKLSGHEETISSVAFSADGTRLISGGAADGTIRIWDVAGRKQIASWRSPVIEICEVAFLPDGKSFVFGAGDGAVRVWDSATGKELANADVHKGGVVNLAVSADGRRVASVGRDGLLRVAEVASIREGATPQGLAKKVLQTAFSPDGRFVAASAEDGLHVLETATLKEAWRIEAAFGPAAFSPDGRRVATGAPMNDGRVWDLAALATADAAPDAAKAFRDTDATIAYRAAWGLVGQGDAAVTTLKSRLLTPPTPEAVAKAFTRLDDDDIRVRETAFQELLGYGPAVEADLRAKLLANPPEALRRPLEDLQRRLAGPVAGSPYLLERTRTLFVLETIGSASAIEVLGELFRSGKSSFERTEAAAALQRLRSRPKR